MAANVSLIYAVKNKEGSMEDLLKAVLEQTRQPDEVIIVDGGSTDRTVDIIRPHIDRGAPYCLMMEYGANIV
jgi:glycosyltransferase involved in cell wall biosynthesis